MFTCPMQLPDPMQSEPRHSLIGSRVVSVLTWATEEGRPNNVHVMLQTKLS